MIRFVVSTIDSDRFAVSIFCLLSRDTTVCTSLKLVCRLFATQSLTLSFSFNSRRQRATGDDFEAARKALEDGRSGLVSFGASDEN